MSTDLQIAAREGAFRRHVEESVALRTAELSALLDAVRSEAAESHRAATHDTLTGLLNRAGLTGTWAQADPSGLILLDLNGFKPVNDTYGHAAGDVVLQVVGQRLTELDAVPARLGGDEFVLIAHNGTDVHHLATQVYKAINQPITLPDGTVVTVSASIGVRTCDGPADLGMVLAQADEAMYLAKANKGTDEDTIAVWVAPVPARVALSGQVVRLRDQTRPRFVPATFPVITPVVIEPVTECVCGELLGYGLRRVGGVLRQAPVHVDPDGCDTPEVAMCAHTGCTNDHSLDTRCSALRDWCCGRCGCLSAWDDFVDAE